MVFTYWGFGIPAITMKPKGRVYIVLFRTLSKAIPHEFPANGNALFVARFANSVHLTPESVALVTVAFMSPSGFPT